MDNYIHHELVELRSLEELTLIFRIEVDPALVVGLNIAPLGLQFVAVVPQKLACHVFVKGCIYTIGKFTGVIMGEPG